MHEPSENISKQRERKYKKIPNRNHGVEEYNNWTKINTRWVYQQTRSNRIKNQRTQRQGSGIHPIKGGGGKERKIVKIAYEIPSGG